MVKRIIFLYLRIGMIRILSHTVQLSSINIIFISNLLHQKAHSLPGMLLSRPTIITKAIAKAKAILSHFFLSYIKPTPVSTTNFRRQCSPCDERKLIIYILFWIMCVYILTVCPWNKTHSSLIIACTGHPHPHLYPYLNHYYYTLSLSSIIFYSVSCHVTPPIGKNDQLWHCWYCLLCGIIVYTFIFLFVSVLQ